MQTHQTEDQKRPDSLYLSILGPFRFTSGDQETIELSSPKIRALLSYLAVEAGYAHTREGLAALLWPESPKAQAFQNLRQSIARLQKCMIANPAGLSTSFFHVNRKTIQLDNGASFGLDCDEFTTALAVVHRHEHLHLHLCHACCQRLEKAIALYRGDFLSSVQLEGDLLVEWMALKRAWFRREALQILNTLVRHAEQRGDADAAYRYAWRRIELEPLLEEAHCQVMVALALSNRRHEALAQYTTLCHLLKTELGSQPTVETTALYQAIRHNDPANLPQLLQTWMGTPSAIDSVVTSQPTQTTPVLNHLEQTPIAPTPPSRWLRPRTWQDVPVVPQLYGRAAELDYLVRAVGVERQRLVAIVGMGGMGKTTLAAATVQRITEAQGSETASAIANEMNRATNFDHLYWQSLLDRPELDSILPLILQSFAGQSMARLPKDLNGQMALLLTLLRRQRALLILDNLESILEIGDSTNSYLAGYESYGQLIQLFAERDHQGCLLITSRELPHEVRRLAHNSSQRRDNFSILQLRGLDVDAGVQLLGLEAGDKESARWSAQVNNLVIRCSGNPLALKLMAQTIRELFAGDIQAYLQIAANANDPRHDGVSLQGAIGDIKAMLDEQLERLSPQEMDVVIWLAIEREPVSLYELQKNLLDPSAQKSLLRTIQSLQLRSLIERTGDGITLPHVVIEHLTQQLVTKICQEIETLQPGRLASHALLKAHGKEYVRQSQARLLLAPIAANITRTFGASASTKQLGTLLNQLRDDVRRPNYVAGNLLNLLLYMGENLRGYDFSQLCVWQADLREANLQNTDFRGADLSGAVFSNLFHTVNSVAFSPDRQLLAAGSGDGAIYLWRMEDYQLQQVCAGSARLIWSIAFSPDGRLLAGSGDDQSIQIWDVGTGHLLYSLHGVEPDQGHSGWVKSIAFSPTDDLLASGGDDGLVCLWDLDRRDRQKSRWAATLIGHTNGVETVAFSPDGQLLASGSQDQLLQLWSVPQKRRIRTFLGHRGAVNTVAFHPSGDMLASGAQDHLVQLWDIRSGRRLQALQGHAGGVEEVAFSPDGELLASASRDQTVRLWQIHLNEDELYTGEAFDTLRGHTNLVKTVAFDTQGRTLVSAGQDRTVRLWRISHALQRLTSQPNSLRGTLPATEQVRALYTLFGQASWIISMAFSPDGRWLATGSNDRAIRLWPSHELPLPTFPSHTVTAHSGWVRALAFSTSGSMIASGGDDGVVRLWALHAKGHFTPLGRLPRLPSGWIEAIVFRPQDDLLAVSDNNGLITLWDVDDAAKPRVVARLQHHQPEAQQNEAQLPEAQYGHSIWVASLAFSPNGQILASGASDNTVCLWQIGRADQIVASQPWQRLIGHDGWVDTVAFSPDGRCLASSGFDNKVYLWEVATGQRRTSLSGHRGIIKSLDFSPDGALLAGGGWKRDLWLWEIGSVVEQSSERGETNQTIDGKPSHTLHGHTHTITNVAFHPAGTMLASSGYDATVRLWDLTTGTCSQRLLPLAPYAGMQIGNTVGLSEAQRTTLIALGAFET